VCYYVAGAQHFKSSAQSSKRRGETPNPSIQLLAQRLQQLPDWDTTQTCAMAKSTRDAAQEQQATLLTSASPSVGFIQNHLDEKLDPAFAALGIEYDLKRRQFVREQPLPVAPDPAVT